MDLSHLPAVDQHAHNVLTPEAAARTPFAAAFTEAHDAESIQSSATQTLCYRRSLRDLAQLFGCPAEEQAVLAHRAALGLERLTDLCLRASNLDAVLLDDGFLPESTQPLAWHRRFVPVYRLLRLETLAQDLLAQERRFEDFLERFRASLDPPPPPVVGLKSIAAYRSGLEVGPVSVEAAREHFLALQLPTEGQSLRLTDKALIDFLLPHALEMAARHRLPIQFHTGFGDPDLDLRQANPLHLRPLLEDRRFARVPVVLLHVYPFVREAGYLASVYPQVHVDFGLGVPLLSVAGMRHTVGGLLELAPTNKLLYSSDAHYIPDLFYLGAKWGRAMLGDVLEGALRDGDLTAMEAEMVAAAVLRDNARALYHLDERPALGDAS